MLTNFSAIFILEPWFWIPLLLIFVGLIIWRATRKDTSFRNGAKELDGTLLLLEIPRTNDKQALAAEQMFASLHGILRDDEELQAGVIQEHLSFEIVSSKQQIKFFVWVPNTLRKFVEGQIYAQYPTVQISEVTEDYARAELDRPVKMSAELVLAENQALPIRSFETFDVDPLAAITGELAKMDESEDFYIQILTRPANNYWHDETKKYIEELKKGKKKSTSVIQDDRFKWWAGLFAALWKPPEGGSLVVKDEKELSEIDKARVAGAEAKAGKLGYQIKIRLIYRGDTVETGRLHMQAILGTFKQFNQTNLNGFKLAKMDNTANLEPYVLRSFEDQGYILNIAELASTYHLPHTNVETPNVVWALTKTAEPPSKLPVLTGEYTHDKEISAFGVTNFRGIRRAFGMLRSDRNRHVYIIGQTGAGKSGLLELFALSDVFHNQGYCIIDPHGDFAINNLKFIPKSRIKDVIYFNPSDVDYPIAFNPLEVYDPARKPNITSEVVGVLKRLFGDSWGPRLEHILRYTILALLDRPSTTMLDISRMLTNKTFRKETLDYCKDVTVLQFWKAEFGQWSDKQVNESIAPVLNKVGAFTANPIIRNIIGQPKSSFDIRKIMDEGKILVVNLSKGLIGEDNAGLLGAFLVTKIQLAAMSRSDIASVEARRPFYLYVDEFQNFATDSFATILSEARKYGLNLTVANQYISQMSEHVRDAVFGNVGSMISFRVSADDAPILSKQFEPQFDAQDLLQMHNRNFILNMIVSGEKQPAFSATTLNLPKATDDNSPDIITHSRSLYSRPRATVEKEISDIIRAADSYREDLREGGGAGVAGGNYTPDTNPNNLNKAPYYPTRTGSGPSPNRSASSSSRNSERNFDRSNFDRKRPFSIQPATPQQQILRDKLSPSRAEGSELSPGLKDLGSLLQQKIVSDARTANGIPQPAAVPAVQPKIPTQKPQEASERPVEAISEPNTVSTSSTRTSAEMPSELLNKPQNIEKTNNRPNNDYRGNKRTRHGAHRRHKSRNPNNSNNISANHA